jgi:hypothetical protein
MFIKMYIFHALHRRDVTCIPYLVTLINTHILVVDLIEGESRDTTTTSISYFNISRHS